MKMLVDLGKVKLSHGQTDGFVARGRGQVGSSSGSDIRLRTSLDHGLPGLSETWRQLKEQDNGQTQCLVLFLAK